jgi:uncharacterized membrane protein
LQKYLVIIFILSILIINLNVNLTANNLDIEVNNISVSRSNGKTRTGDFDWGDIEVISEPIFGKDYNTFSSALPKIAVEDDKIYVVWIDNNDTNGAGTTDHDIFYRYFDGNKWAKIQVISEPVLGQNFNTGDSYFPDIAVENGKIYVVWQDDNNTNSAGTDLDIFYRCNLTGTRWENTQVISQPVLGKNYKTGGSRLPNIAVENSKIYVSWSDNNNTDNAYLDFDIFYRCNLTGNGWEDIQVISEPVQGQNFNTGGSGYYSGPEISVENGNIYIVWPDGNNTNNADLDGDIFFRCNLTGSFWEPIQVISEPVQGQNFSTEASNNPSIAVNNGNIYVVWSDQNDTNNASDDADIFYRCNLTGNRWEEIQVISEPIFHQNFNDDWSEMPEITVENNVIYVIWRDPSNINNAGQDGDIFYRCNFTGIYWEDIQVISEPIIGKNFNTESSYQLDIVVNQGKSHIVWDDSNLSNNAGYDSDIFYRSISLNLGLGSPTVTPIIGNSSTDFTFTVTYFHLDKKNPIEIAVLIDGIKYLMSEVNPNDNNFMDGKDYFFDNINLDLGMHTYQFYTSDGLKSISSKIYNEPIVFNSQPKITTENNITAFEDIYYTVDYEFEDIDIANVGQSVTFSNFSTNAKWLTFDETTGILSGTATNDDVGEYWVNISIYDTIDSDFTNFTLTVINVNDAPIIITNDTISINEDEFYEVYYEALDVDTPQNNLNWFMSSNASWLEFDQKSAILSGLPENNDLGEFWVNISVNDGEYIDFSNFTLEVINVNDPPKIITKEINVAYEDNYYEMDFEAEDLDNVQNDLKWTINTNAQWLNVDNTKSIINGTPTNDDVGEYWINLSITDGEYTDDRDFTLKVENTNDPPEIIVKKMINGKLIVWEIAYTNVGELYSRNFEVEDIDPLPQTFSWYIQTNATNWLNLDSMTGLLFGESSEKDIGTYWVNVSVTDREGGWDHYNFTLKVHKSPSRKEDTSDSSFISTESFYGLIWIIIIIVILLSIIILFTLRKQKKEIIHILEKREYEVIQTVKAELMQTTPSHMSLPGETPTEGIVSLPAQPTVTTTNEGQPMKAIGTTPLPQQYQLPKATLSKEQELKLLRERFLKGEVSEEIYGKLRSEIEGSDGQDISAIDGEFEEPPAISGQQQVEPTSEPTKIEESFTTTPELEDKPPQQIPINPEVSQQLSNTQTPPEKTIEKDGSQINDDSK